MKKTSKFLSIILSVLMIITAIPITASADTSDIELDEFYNIDIPKDGFGWRTFTPTESGKYIVRSVSDMYSGSDPYVFVRDSEDNYVADDDDHKDLRDFYCDFDAVAGETYYFYFYDNSNIDTEYAIIVEKYMEITHQPTADEPYVELNWDVETYYQWYMVESEYVEITDIEGTELDYPWGESYYDSENGWTGVDDGGEIGFYDFFTVFLKKGQTITVELTGDFNSVVGIYDYSEDAGIDTFVNDATEYELTAEWDGFYTVYTCSYTGNVNVKAYYDLYSYHAVQNATESTIQPTTDGVYCCQVWFEDGTEIWSDFFEVSGLGECDCICHVGGFTTLLFKIINFFASLFNPDRRVCACGLPH